MTDAASPSASRIPPALLYVLWLLGIWLGEPQLGLALKALAIPFDLALATLLALITGRLVSSRAAYGAAALYLFNPADLLAGPIWGQVDAAGTLFFRRWLSSRSCRRDERPAGTRLPYRSDPVTRPSGPLLATLALRATLGSHRSDTRAALP